MVGDTHTDMRPEPFSDSFVQFRKKAFLPTKFGPDNDLQVCERPIIDLIFARIAVNKVPHASNDALPHHNCEENATP